MIPTAWALRIGASVLIGGMGYGWLQSHDAAVAWKATADSRFEALKDSSHVSDSLRRTVDSTRIALNAVVQHTKQSNDSLKQVALVAVARQTVLRQQLRHALPDSLKSAFDSTVQAFTDQITALSGQVRNEQMAKEAALRQVAADSTIITRITADRDGLKKFGEACLKQTGPKLKDRITQIVAIGAVATGVLNRLGVIHILDSPR